MPRAVRTPENELDDGVGRVAEIDHFGGAEVSDDKSANEHNVGDLGPLLGLTKSYEDVQRTRLALLQRGQTLLAAQAESIEDLIAKQIRKELMNHPIGDWLPPGTRGVHVARLVALIGDPHRFPGAKCAAGHYHPAKPGQRNVMTGTACGLEQADGTICQEIIGPPQPGTGTRSLWKYLGLHVDEGKLPMRRKGKQADWNPTGRTICLMPGGIAEQIVRQRVPKYREIYDQAKERLIRERGVVANAESDVPTGAEMTLENASTNGAGKIGESESASGALPPWKIDKIARIIAVKAFVGDLLAEMKRRM